MGDCEKCTERQGYYMDAETIQRQQEHIRQLEAQVSALARENAELKQVPTRSDDSPRCPLRDGMTGEMGACDKRCALIVSVGGVLMCAEAARVATKAQMEPVRAVNYWDEVD